MDKEIISRICDVDLSVLPNLNLERLKYDTCNPFSKYYSLDIINKVVQKFNADEMTLEELNTWFNAYNWILNGGFKDFANSLDDEVIDLIRSELSWIIDALGFASKEEVDEYYESIKTLDDILNTSKEWIIYYFEDEEEQFILLVNENKNKFVEICSDFFETGDETDKLIPLTKKEFKNKINLLKALNYQKVEY